jgi:glycine/D-amino acid oxidase-like deaminating enzyme
LSDSRDVSGHRAGDEDATVRLDLRSGRSLWDLKRRDTTPASPLRQSVTADVVVIGAGITGAFAAERLTREGRSVLVVDRHEPQTASTAASTALLQWEIDAPLLELEDRLGFEAAARIYRASFGAVQAIRTLLADLGVAMIAAEREALFLAGTALDAHDLREECRLRRAAGLPSRFLDGAELATSFGFRRDAALLSAGSAEADPVELARVLLDRAVARGARIASPTTVTDYAFGFAGADLATAEGPEIHAQAVILANGYEMPLFVPAEVHRVVSTFAIATAAQPAGAIWPRRALVWEASEPYSYMRTTAEGHIIIGGEDEEIAEARMRDALLPAKAERLRGTLAELVPSADTRVETAWCGFFGETFDGLPLIGAVPGQPRCFAAFGYGGNGITFSALAADLVADLLAGRAASLTGHFAIDRAL